MDARYRSQRAELAAVRAELSAKGASTRHIAHVIRARYKVNSRVAYRLARGLTQQQVADTWNRLWPPSDGQPTITHKHLSYWETWPGASGRVPLPDTLNRLARIYQANAADLLDGEDHSEPDAGLASASVVPTSAALTGRDGVSAGPSDVLARLDQFIASSDTLVTRESGYHQLVKELIEWACRMNRRDILQWLSSAAAAAAAAPVLDGLDSDERRRVSDALIAPQRVDGAVIDHIEAVLWRCMRQDDALGPQAALDTVLAQRSLVRNLLPAAPDTFKVRLLSLYASLSAFTGWLSYDLGNYVDAEDYYETARSAAHEAQNTELGAYVLCNMSQIATWRGRPRVGIDHARAAQGWATQTGDLPLQAYAYDVAARALAMDGNERAALDAIHLARTTLTRADKEQPTLVYFYSPGQLASTESGCHLHLGNPGSAERVAEFAMTAIDPSFVRNLAMVSLKLSACRLQLARPDVAGAAAAIGNAARLAAHNRSARVAIELQRGWRKFEPWRDVAEVRTAGDLLSAYGLV